MNLIIVRVNRGETDSVVIRTLEQQIAISVGCLVNQVVKEDLHLIDGESVAGTRCDLRIAVRTCVVLRVSSIDAIVKSAKIKARSSPGELAELVWQLNVERAY